jgi:hypothetical protein
MGNVIPTPPLLRRLPGRTVVTTPGDHIKLLLAYLNQGRYNGYRLLQPKPSGDATPETRRGRSRSD